MQDLKEILMTTYQQRHALNAQYSRNAFSRDLGVSPAALSQFLSGKRKFSPRNIQRIVSKLCLPPETVKRLRNRKEEISQATELKIATFSLIADWYYFAILNLAEVMPIKNELQISQRLGISPSTAQLAVDRLLKMKFLKKVNGRFSRLQRSLDTGTDIPSEAIRKHNREKMELAIQSLNYVPVSERDISSLTLTFDPEDMVKVKQEIQMFKKRISKICEKRTASEVYSLNVQFHPLSKKEFSR